jgi:hypothetical protein
MYFRYEMRTVSSMEKDNIRCRRLASRSIIIDYFNPIFTGGGSKSKSEKSGSKLLPWFIRQVVFLPIVRYKIRYTNNHEKI